MIRDVHDAGRGVGGSPARRYRGLEADGRAGGTVERCLAQVPAVPEVRAEKGCIEYVPVVDADTDLAAQTRYGPDTFTVIEKWESVEALRAHGAAPHMAAYAAKTQDLVAERAIYVLSEA